MRQPFARWASSLTLAAPSGACAVAIDSFIRMDEAAYFVAILARYFRT